MNTFTLERNNYRRKLIMLVKQHPILWNKTQENYNRNRPQKILAWHQISEQLDITGKWGENNKQQQRIHNKHSKFTAILKYKVARLFQKR